MFIFSRFLFASLVLFVLSGCDIDEVAGDCSKGSSFVAGDVLVYDIYSATYGFESKTYEVKSRSPLDLLVTPSERKEYSLSMEDVCSGDSYGDYLDWDEKVLFGNTVTELKQSGADCYADVYVEGGVSFPARFCELSYIDAGDHYLWNVATAQSVQFGERVVAFGLQVNGSQVSSMRLSSYSSSN